MDIVEKMKKWDTWDAMVKDVDPYLAEVVNRSERFDESIVPDFYILEFINQWAKVEFPKRIDELIEREDTLVRTYCDVVANIMKLHHYNDKLDDVLEAQTNISDYEKKSIREDWEKQHAIETKGDENLVVVEEDSMMVDYLKARCDELANCKVKIDDVRLQKEDANGFFFALSRVTKWIACQKIINEGPSYLHNEHKKRVHSMMAEDTIVAIPPHTSFAAGPNIFGVNLALE